MEKLTRGDVYKELKKSRLAKQKKGKKERKKLTKKGLYKNTLRGFWNPNEP